MPKHAADAPARRLDLVAVVAVAAGGVLGAEARYAVSATWPQPVGDFPWGVIGVNAVGCLLIGVLAVLLDSTSSRLAWPFLAVGVLGGFTTFSTYALDALRLLDADRPVAALAYVVCTVLIALATVTLGASMTRMFARRAGAR